MKNILSTICCIGFIIIASSCSKTAEDIPLKNIDEHRKYQDGKIIGREIKDTISDEERYRIYNEGYPADLISEYQQFLNKNPKSAEALYLLYRVKKNRELIDKSLKINPKFYYSMVSKGQIYIENEKNFKKADSIYKKAVSINPKENRAHYCRGCLYIDLYDNNIKNSSYTDQAKIKILLTAKSEFYKLSSNWEFSQSYINKEINDINYEIEKLYKKIKLEVERIKLEKKLCSQYEHEEFLRIAFKGLGKSIYQINLMAKNECSYGWYVLAYNKYGGISTCQIVTVPNYETGEIECKSVSCDD
jgi:hypothetical protein